MGRIEDQHNSRKDRRERKESDSDPLSGEIGNRTEKHNDFDVNDKTIKDQQNKK